MATDDEAHGLSVQDVPRARYRQTGPQIPAGSETCGDGLISEPPERRGVSLGRADKAGDVAFNSAI